MFGIFDGIEKSISNVIDVGIGVMTLGEYGDFSQYTVSKMVADGIEIAIIAQFFNVGEDVIKDMIND
ncbi:MAG: hypothetical protein KAI79_18600 [Bacteroidales bacterium]|nr:hypothetical protein [Bacteroidales bacterium]